MWVVNKLVVLGKEKMLFWKILMWDGFKLILEEGVFVVLVCICFVNVLEKFKL